MHTRRYLSVVLISAGLAASGCGPVVKRTTIASATEIFQDGQTVFYREEDLELAEQALASQLKLLEVFIEAAPDNEDLLLQASQGFGAYTFAFVEDKIAEYHNDPQLAHVQRERARRLYLRGRDYGLRVLSLRHEPFATARTADLPAFREMLQPLSKEDVPAIFWAAYGWGGAINWSRNHPDMIADVPRVVAMMRRALELDEKYFFAGPHLFFGVYYAARSPALGGNPSRAKFHLDRALDLTGGKLLLVRLFLADPYAVQTQDRALFETQVRLILDAPDDLSPQHRLLNEVAKIRAQLLRKRTDELFL
ncbi:MAG: TRAP transporter TatT component family protein [Candidatus Methylomirabilales bacterium]